MPISPDLAIGQRYGSAGISLGDSQGTAVASHVSIHTKGAWIELDSASDIDAHGIIVYIESADDARRFLVDIGIGAGGSEQLIINNLHVDPRGFCVHAFPFPISIPVGTRIAARCQSTVGSAGCRVALTLLSHGFLGGVKPNVVTTYGAATGTTGGTQIDPGATANTKGAYSELTAATTAPIRELLVSVGNRSNTALALAGYLLDIAIGAAASEQVIIPNLPITAGSLSNEFAPHVFPPLSVNIPTGTRLSARAQSTTNNATDRLFDVVLYGTG